MKKKNSFTSIMLESTYADTMKPIGLNSVVTDTLKFMRPVDFSSVYADIMKSIDFGSAYADTLKSMKPIMLGNEVLNRSVIFGTLAPKNKVSLLEHQLQKLYSDLERSIPQEQWSSILEASPNIEFHEDGSASVGSDTITRDQLQSMLERTAKNIGSSVELAVNPIVAQLESLKKPVWQKILLYFIIPLAVSIFANLLWFFVMNHVFVDHDKRTIVKQVRNDLVSHVEKTSDLSSFKIVSARVLRVRREATRKSPEVGRLYTGDIVKVLKKGKNWAQVEWSDEKGQSSIQGWVFSRYLKNIRK